MATTKYPELEIIVNGESVTWEEVNRWKARRAAHALQEMNELGASLTLSGNPLSVDRLHELSNDELLAATKETKLALGQDGILKLYHDKLTESDRLYKEYVAHSEKGQHKLSETIIKVKGITPETMQKIGLTTGGVDLAGGFDLHPEHFIFSQTGNVQNVMETVGAYKEPTYMHLIVTDPKDYMPAQPDPDAKMFIVGYGELASDGSKMEQWAMHQFIPTNDGLTIKLGMYVPTGAPDELVIGHREHFAIEFGSVITKALDQIHANQA